MTNSLHTKTILKRGFFNRCPSCGNGKLLHKYITPFKNCSDCGLDYAPLRADDGPAWATILITGHLAMPFTFWLLEYPELSSLMLTLLLIGIVTILSAIILPRAKGIFMAIIWVTAQKKASEQEEATDKQLNH